MKEKIALEYLDDVNGGIISVMSKNRISSAVTDILRRGDKLYFATESGKTYELTYADKRLLGFTTDEVFNVLKAQLESDKFNYLKMETPSWDNTGVKEVDLD